MANVFSAKCDLCGKVETSDSGPGLSIKRFMINLETKHACEPCWGVLKAAFNVGLEGIKDPLGQVNRLTQEVQLLKSQLEVSRHNEKSQRHNLDWRTQDYETMRERLRAVSDKYSDLVGTGEGLFSEFAGIRTVLQEAKAKWGGFWSSLLHFDRTKKDFAARVDRMMERMDVIEGLWPRDKQPAPTGAEVPKAGGVISARGARHEPRRQAGLGHSARLSGPRPPQGGA